MNRQDEAVKLHASGLTDLEISQRMGVKVVTIKTYLSHSGVRRTFTREVENREARQDYVIVYDPTDTFKAGAVFDKINVEQTLLLDGWAIGTRFLNRKTGELFVVCNQDEPTPIQKLHRVCKIEFTNGRKR